ncbi:MAG: beta-ketoacyl-ACP synthase II [Clostridia bacterium]|nr:beta-ketoacyl-ACP synthase II [Clostridia bacterium]
MRRVVITGMGAVTPIGNDIKTFWDGLINGKNGIDKVTKFDATGFKATLAAEVKDFDPLVAMEKGEARKTDLYTQYALVAAAEAVTDSGIEGTIESDRIGVYVGSGIGGMGTFCEEHSNLLEKGERRVSPLFIPKMITNIAAGNIAIKYGFNGPCFSLSTACATGTHSIGEAYRAIKHGHADAMVTGGSEATINPLAFAGFINCMALSTSEDKDAASIPFDARRGGFIMGEGAGILVLEEYERAVARGAKIYGEIVGYGSTCDAHHITAPDPEAKWVAKAILNAMEEADLVGETNVYVNTHGTSTPLNDKTETAALHKAFGEGAKDIHMSSTKSMTGHMLGAAGAVEAIAAVLALKEGIIPPTIGYSEADIECDINCTPNKAVKADIVASYSTSLGFGGHNACLAFKAVK